MKISELLAFPEFYAKIKGEKLPLKTAYKLSKLSTAIDKEVEFYRTKFQEIIAEYGLKDEEGKVVPTDDGQGVKLIAGKEEECMSKVNELMAIESDNLPDITFNLDEFGNIDLSPEEVGAIAMFINE